MMQTTAQEEYLVTQVMTASPQKLQLMLIEAALRHCDLARRQFAESQEDQAGASLVRAQDIVTELLASLNYGEHRELVGRIAGVYNFIYRSLVTAHLRRDTKSLADAVRVLEIERETWRELAQRSPGNSSPQSATSLTAHTPHAIPAPAALTDVPTSSLSLEA